MLNAYEQIGETIPQLLQDDRLFAEDANMERVLGLIYSDILEFHRRALVVFKRRYKEQLCYFEVSVIDIINCLEASFSTHLEGFQHTF